MSSTSSAPTSAATTHTKESPIKSLSRKRPHEEFAAAYTLNRNESMDSTSSSNANKNHSGNGVPNSSITLYQNLDEPSPGPSSLKFSNGFSGVEQSPPVVSYIVGIYLESKSRNVSPDIN
jgi:hypothetical protein